MKFEGEMLQWDVYLNKADADDLKWCPCRCMKYDGVIGKIREFSWVDSAKRTLTVTP